MKKVCEYCHNEYEWNEGQLNWGKYYPKNGKNTVSSKKFCCYECGMKVRTLKTQQTNLQKWGTICTLHAEEIVNKVKQTNLERYGTENPMKNCEIKAKVENTMLEKYGVKNALKLEEFKKKAEETTMKNYDVKHPAQSKQVLDKMKNTCLKKYGVENASQIEEIKLKKETSVQKRYGVKNPFQIKEIMDKLDRKEMLKKCYDTKKKNNTFNVSRIEDKIYKLLKEKFDDVKRQYKSEVYPFPCDFYIKDIDTYIEFQGYWVHGWKSNKEIYGAFDENNIKHVELLEEWKSKNKEQYRYAIKVWTIRDPLKRKVAKDNNLNWLEFWTIEDVEKWLKEI